MATKKKKMKMNEEEVSVKHAVVKGDVFTKASMLIMGCGNIVRKQVLKGLLFLGIEIAYIYFMISRGIGYLERFIALGGEPQQEVWNDAKGIYEYTAGDNSLLMLLYGVVAIAVTIGFIIIWRGTLKSAYQAELCSKNGKHVNSLIEDIKDLFDFNLHRLLLTLPIGGILIFTILPLIFMICMAFTNYSKIGDHLVLFNWVGLANFKKILNFQDAIGQSFYSVLAWTLVWAVLATFLNYILGMMLAMVINRKGTKAKGFWRFCFILSAAVPQFVSLLIMRSMLQSGGAFNTLLMNIGLITKPLPFWTDTTWARATVIIINLWVGIPFTMMQVTGILQNIPVEMYEAAKIDGANAVQSFFRITLPYMLFVTTPYLITQFTGNVNNFNVIFLLSGGNPTPVGATAGKTDLLVTWLYKLTIDKQYYNLGAVIGIMTFIVLAIVALVTYRSSGSYKDEEAMQ